MLSLGVMLSFGVMLILGDDIESRGDANLVLWFRCRSTIFIKRCQSLRNGDGTTM